MQGRRRKGALANFTASSTWRLWCQIVTVIILFTQLSCSAEALKTCKTQDGTITVPCENGACTVEGICKCYACWSGISCDTFLNSHTPKFQQSEYDAKIDTTTFVGTNIYKVEATDEDFFETCRGQYPCACANISYSIQSGNRNSVFMIDPETGKISLTQGTQLQPNSRYILEISARNPVTGITLKQAITKLTIHTTSESHSYENSDEKLMPRRKRYAPTNAVPSFMTFALEKIGENANVTEIAQGTQLSFRLFIHFTNGTTDMTVEIFTPANQTTIMILCPPIISYVGSNLQINEVTPVLESKSQTALFDRAVFNFGNVTNNMNDVTKAENSILQIDFNATMINPATSSSIKNQTFWVSAGAEYNNQNDIWVGQSMYIAKESNKNVTGTPKFNLTGPTKIPIASSAKFRLDLNLPILTKKVKVDVFPPLNTSGVMSVCNLKVRDTGRNFACLPVDYIEGELINSRVYNGNSKAHINMGDIVNSGIMSSIYDSNEDWISLQFAMNVFDDASLVGKQFWIGASVTMDSDFIWTGQYLVEIDAKVDISTTTPLTVSTNVKTPIVSNLQPSITYLDIHIPDGEQYDLSIDVETPFNTATEESYFRLCKVAVLSAGDNVACVSRDEPKYLTRAGDRVPSYTRLDLGRVTNTGMMEGKKNQSANVIKVQIVATPLEKTAAQKYTVKTNVNYGKQKTFPKAYDVTVTSAPMTLPTNITPDYNVDYAQGTGSVVIGASTDLLVNVTFIPGSFFSNLNIESLAPTDSQGAKYTFCSIRAVHIGRNLPCVKDDDIKRNVKFVSSSDDNKYDQAFVNMTDLCVTSEYPDEVDNRLSLLITVRMEDHPANSNNSKDWVTVGLYYNNKTILVFQNSLWTLRGQVADVVPGGTERVDVVEVSPVSSLPVGYVTGYNVSVKIPPLSSISVVVNASTTSPSLQICALKVIAVGSGLGCIVPEKDILEIPDSNMLKKAGINFGPVTNIGTDSVHDSYFFDKTTLLMQLVVKLTDTVTATNPLEIQVKLGSQTPKVFPFNLKTALDTTGITMTTQPLSNVTSFIGAITGNDTAPEIVKGQSKRVLTQFYVPADMVRKMKIETTLDQINQVEMSDYNVVYKGENLPCIDKGRKSVIESNLAKGTLDLGLVCSWPFETLDKNANLLQVESIVKLRSKSSLTNGDQVSVSTGIFLDDSLVDTSTLRLSVTDVFQEYLSPSVNATFNETMLRLNSTNSGSGISMKIGQVIILPVVISIPPNSTVHVKLEAIMPVSETADLTVLYMKYASSGENIARVGDPEDQKLSLTSVNGTSQKDRGVLDLGVVTNTGITYRKELTNEEDNLLVVEVTLQLTDSLSNTNSAKNIFQLIATVGPYVAYLENTVLVERSLKEGPKIFFEGFLNDTGRPLNDHFMTVYSLIKHENTSMSELHPVYAIFYLPPFVQFDDQLISNMTGSSPTKIYDSKSGQLTIKFDHLYFTDIISFSFAVVRRPNATATRSLVNSTVPFEAGGYIIHRPGSIHQNGTYFSSPMDALMFAVQFPPVIDTCGGKLDYSNCQVLVSPESKYENGVFEPFIRAGEFSSNRYLQIYFGNKVRVERVSIMRQTPSEGDVLLFNLAYSDDGISWVPGDKIKVNSGHNTVLLYNTVTRTRAARYVRFYVVEHTGNPDAHLSMKLNFYGCNTTNDVTDVCTSAPKRTDPKGWYNRGFLSTTDGVYLCDADPKMDLQMICYFSQDGTTWYPLDRRVANVNAYVIETSPEKNHFFGISADRKSYMTSQDGVIWMSAEPRQAIDKIETCQPPACIKNIAVPWLNQHTIGTNSPQTQFINNMWGATYEGLLKKDASGWKRVVNW